LPGPASRQWWEVDYLPLRQGVGSGGSFLLGRIRVLEAEAPGTAPLPERLVNLRQRAVAHHSLAPWEASPVPAVRRLVEQARLAAQVRVPVLLVGEPGSGKRTLARAIHGLGPAREQPFIALDCRRLPPFALSAILFGERAAAGAFYLREPACLPRDVQLRLGELLAGDRGQGPRLMAGCRRPPEEEVRQGRLLEELAFALSTLVLEVPPLRQRRDDLPLLVDGLLERANAEGETKVTGLAADGWEVVRAYPWPGNLRELYQALASARHRTAGERLTAADLPASIRQAVNLAQAPAPPAGDKALSLDQLLKQAEQRLLEMALRRAGGHKTRAAQILGIWRGRLMRRMKALNVADPENDIVEIEEGDEPE
jgi:DNA-binding NtrC family response regulator